MCALTTKFTFIHFIISPDIGIRSFICIMLVLDHLFTLHYIYIHTYIHTYLYMVRATVLYDILNERLTSHIDRRAQMSNKWSHWLFPWIRKNCSAIV